MMEEEDALNEFQLVEKIIGRLLGHPEEVLRDAQGGYTMVQYSAILACRTALFNGKEETVVRTPAYLAALLRELLRKNSEPLLGFASYTDLMQMESVDQDDLGVVNAVVTSLDRRAASPPIRALLNAVLLFLQSVAKAKGEAAALGRAKVLAERYGNALLRPQQESLRTLSDYDHVIELVTSLVLHWSSIDSTYRLPAVVEFEMLQQGTSNVSAAAVPLKELSEENANMTASTRSPQPGLSRRGDAAQSMAVLSRRTPRSESAGGNPGSSLQGGGGSGSGVRPYFNVSEPREKVRATVYDAIEELIREYRTLQELIVTTPLAKDLVRVAKAVATVRKNSTEVQALVAELSSNATNASSPPVSNSS